MPVACRRPSESEKPTVKRCSRTHLNPMLLGGSDSVIQGVSGWLA
jgi:hypothetical protein